MRLSGTRIITADTTRCRDILQEKSKIYQQPKYVKSLDLGLMLMPKQTLAFGELPQVKCLLLPLLG